MEESALLIGLASNNAQERTAAVEALRVNVSRNGGRLRFKMLEKLFTALADVLKDQNWNLRKDTLTFLAELMPSCGPEVEKFVLRVVPGMLLNFADTKIAVRKAAHLCVQVG